jgi:hypothetical protein
VSNPPGPPHGDPTRWGPPGDRDPRDPQRPQGPPGPPRRPGPQSEGPTQRIERPGRPADQPTQHIPRSGQGSGPPHPSTPPPGPPPSSGPTPAASAPEPKRRPRWRNPIWIVLTLVIIVAMLAAGLVGAELYARGAANDALKKATACETKSDQEQTEDNLQHVNVSFSSTPPVLWQYMSKHYTSIRVSTDGDHIGSVKGLKADIQVKDIRLDADAKKEGSVGSIDATITWTSAGILQTIQDKLDIADFLVEGVKTDPRSGTVTLEGTLGSGVVIEPRIENGNLRLVIPENGIDLVDFSLPRDSAQQELDDATKELNNNALNVRADSVQVTNDGVKVHLSAKNSDIPAGGGEDSCFSNL